MIEALTLAAGGGLSAVSALIGAAVHAGFVRNRQPKPPPPPKLRCSCRDGYGTHGNGDDGGACNGFVQRQSGWDGIGHAIAWEYVPCPCKKYDGPPPPVPIETYITRQIALPEAGQ
jgi:hypothetical protein